MTGVRFLRLAIMLPALLSAMGLPLRARAQEIVLATVDRPPFSFERAGARTGFSIELARMVGQEIGREVSFRRADSFPEMLELVRRGEVDAAIANISITAARERVMDFSQPIFRSGIQVMIHRDGGGVRAWWSAGQGQRNVGRVPGGRAEYRNAKASICRWVSPHHGIAA